MNKKLLLALPFFLFALAANAQFGANDIKYWIGSGTDTTMLVVDFNDNTPDSSYAWGYLHDGSATGEDLLNAITADDENFMADITGGSLNNLYYGIHEGIGGSPHDWASFDGAHLSSLDTNAGIGTPLISGGWFGLSYSNWNPLTAPDHPVAAYPPDAFTMDDVQFFTGSGTDTAILVVDFLDLNQPSAYAWGYLFTDSTTGAEMLDSIAAADPLLDVVMANGYLNDITYDQLVGIGGSPNYWGTWSATNYGNWIMNIGLGTKVMPGHFFGVTYTDFNPALRPDIPAAAENTTGIGEWNEAIIVKAYPQPASDILIVEIPKKFASKEVSVYSLSGEKLLSRKAEKTKFTLDVSSLPRGAYILKSGKTSFRIIVE